MGKWGQPWAAINEWFLGGRLAESLDILRPLPQHQSDANTVQQFLLAGLLLAYWKNIVSLLSTWSIAEVKHLPKAGAL